MKYIDQSHKDLRLYALDEETPLSKFTVISQSSFSYESTNVEFGILAESHFVTVYQPEGTFSEICACTKISIPNAVQMQLTDLGDASHKLETKHHNYLFTYKTTNSSVGEAKLVALRSKRPHPHCYYLEHVFPTSKPGEVSPVTEIYVTVGDEILIESVHTYPNHDAMVFTTSTLTEVKSTSLLSRVFKRSK